VQPAEPSETSLDIDLPDHFRSIEAHWHNRRTTTVQQSFLIHDIEIASLTGTEGVCSESHCPTFGTNNVMCSATSETCGMLITPTQQMEYYYVLVGMTESEYAATMTHRQ